MQRITPFTPGRPLLSEVTADKLNQILAEIRRNRPVVAAPLTARVAGDGTFISLAKQSSGGTSATVARQPWDLIARVNPSADPEDENPPYLIKVHPGTISGFLPTNYDEEFPVAGEGLHYAKAVIATNGNEITSITIAIDDVAPVQQEPAEWAIAEEVEFLFGLFSEGATQRTVADSVITLTPRVWMTLPKTTLPEPGELPYNVYYYLG